MPGRGHSEKANGEPGKHSAPTRRGQTPCRVKSGCVSPTSRPPAETPAVHTGTQVPGRIQTSDTAGLCACGRRSSETHVRCPHWQRFKPLVLLAPLGNPGGAVCQGPGSPTQDNGSEFQKWPRGKGKGAGGGGCVLTSGGCSWRSHSWETEWRCVPVSHIQL